MLSYGIGTTLLEILISLRFPIHPFKNVYWCSRKGLSELSDTSIHWCFEKRTAPTIPSYFPAKHLGWSSFKIPSQAFLGFSKKLFRAAIL